MAQQNNVTNVSGTISAAVYNNNNVFTLTNSAGVSTPYTLSPTVAISRAGATSVPAAYLQVGDVVNIQTSGNLVTHIQVTTLAQNNQAIDVMGLFNPAYDAQGRIASISFTQNNVTTTYTISPNVVITGDRTELVQNHLVQLKGYNQLITSIEVK